MNYKKILFAVDNSKYSLHAVKKGMELADQLNAEVALVTVVDPTATIGNAEAGVYSEELWDNFMDDARQVLNLIEETYPHRKIEKFVRTGNPIFEVVNAANEWNADLIVTGTHGRSGLSHLLMGSVAESILKNTDVPVLMITLK